MTGMGRRSRRESAARGSRRGWSLANTGEDSRKYRACQLLYWYRSNELWKITERKSRQVRFKTRTLEYNSHLVSMRLECLSGLKQRLQAGKNTWPPIGTSSVIGVILGPLVMRHRYFCGFGLGHQFDRCA
jgi:hypothetical protein